MVYYERTTPTQGDIMEKIKSFGRKVNENKGVIIFAVATAIAVGAVKDRVYHSDTPAEA